MYDCGREAIAKMEVYFPQGEIMCLLIIWRNKRKILKQRAVETKQSFFFFFLTHGKFFLLIKKERTGYRSQSQ